MLGLANFPFPSMLPLCPCSVNQSAGCQQGAGWRLAGDALSSISFDPTSFFTGQGVQEGHQKSMWSPTFFFLGSERLLVVTSVLLSHSVSALPCLPSPVISSEGSCASVLSKCQSSLLGDLGP